VVNGEKDFSGIQQGDVVILPAFGASVQEMELLNGRGCTIVDTTCPWVSKVWHTVEKHKKNSHTSIIHGQYKHEETVATSSFAGIYLIVLNLAQAQYVSDYILNGGDRSEFIAKFSNACSVGFDPDRHLQQIGIANQTTMLKGETEQIGKLFEHNLRRHPRAPRRHV
jgi:4-hydroxy-3-methylbut-2-en-1-yl diphosphate reductase